MDSTISDLALDLGEFALDNELEKARQQPPAPVLGMRASSPHDPTALSKFVNDYGRRFSPHFAKVRRRPR